MVAGPMVEVVYGGGNTAFDGSPVKERKGQPLRGGQGPSRGQVKRAEGDRGGNLIGEKGRESGETKVGQ